ncbi:hypothetical protein HMPREF1431_00567 [Helicobacter pylori GAMchJs106B]|uniref:DUF3226 domain-containing protein n=1 Tax=Helicobacter pylori TaxID=210 RepID=UPI0002BAAA44|nr:DUF3226 domain-containing protein [Helicobacter pylori]EMH43504.1 hypothetical protein HMPREF1431_00567 [Helicobacter pylori GAMchJs106B]
MADKEILIFVEGSRDKVFLEVYLYFLEDLPIKNFKVKDVKGKDNLSKRLLEIEKYAKTLIIFDTDIKKENQESDAGFDNKLKHIYEKFKEKGTDFPKEQIFLFPNNQDDGDLETLLFKIAKHKEIIQCFERYLKCIECKCIGIKEHHEPIKNIRKSKWYAYLEALCLTDLYTKDVFDSKGKIKEKHKEEYEKLKEAIDFNSNFLIPLKNFLGQFAENKQKTNLF